MSLAQRPAMSLQQRLADATRGIVGAVAGVSVDGVRETAAIGLADAESGAAMTVATRLPMASLTKPVVATAAVRSGLPLTEPVRLRLPALASHWRADPGITLTHLLSHTSGLRKDLTPEESEGHGDGDDAFERGVITTVQHGQSYRLGATWQYCNAGFGLAGYALATATGHSFEDAIAAAVLTPAGMTNTGFGRADAVGHTNGQPVRETYFKARRAGGGIVSTVGDILTFAEFAMADPSFAATGRPVTPTLFGSRYGLGWNLNHGGRVRWHTGDWGGCHSALLIVPARRVAVVLVINDDAGDALRVRLAWSELALRTGLGWPRLDAAALRTHAAGRTVLARLHRRRTVTP